MWYLWLDGYVAAFALGFFTAMMVTIMLNDRQIRRNSETIRRNSEIIHQNNETIRRQVEAQLATACTMSR